MSLLTTGYPLLDLLIAIIVGYGLAWFFVVRPLRNKVDTDDSRSYDTDTELLTSHREVDRLRADVKSLKASVASSEETTAVLRDQLTKAQNDVKVITEEKKALAAEAEARAHQILELQSQSEKLAAEAKMAAFNIEGIQLKANLAILAAEHESMKSLIAARQIENQLLRIQTSGIPSTLETPLLRVPSAPHSYQEAPADENHSLHNNFGVDMNQPNSQA